MPASSMKGKPCLARTSRGLRRSRPERRTANFRWCPLLRPSSVNLTVPWLLLRSKRSVGQGRRDLGQTWQGGLRAQALRRQGGGPIGKAQGLKPVEVLYQPRMEAGRCETVPCAGRIDNFGGETLSLDSRPTALD